MTKNNFPNYTYLILVGIFIFLIPGILHAELPRGLDFIEDFAKLFPLFLLYWPIVVVIVSSVIKIWLLKRRLSIPWKLKSIEKLCLGVLGETVVEFIFLNLIMWMFKPAVHDVLNIQTATSPKGPNLILHIAIVIPWYCIMGTISMLILINFLTTLDKKELRRQYLKTGALLSLILPMIIILILTAGILFFKGNP
jgi:hypothetical protein